MYAKVWKPVLLMAFLLLFLTVNGAYASAQAPTGEGPFDAMAPTEEWMELEPGELHWYLINFDRDEDEANEPLEIRMFAEPYASATLTVRNQDQVDEWIRDGEQLHFGCCTMVDRDLNLDGNPDYAEWAGTLTASGDYYIVIEHAKNVAENANYRFTVKGKNISYPTMTEDTMVPEPMAAAAPMPETDATMQPVMLTEMAGSGPDFALAPTGEWTMLEPGEYHWYFFDFDFDEDIARPVEVRLFAEPYESAILTVRNEDQAQLWRDEGEQLHFGCCSMVDIDKNDDGMRDYGVWAGSLRESGRYYIVLEHARDKTEPAYYRFTISGDNLSFPPMDGMTITAAAPESTTPETEAMTAEPMAAAAPAPMPEEMNELLGTGPDFAMEPTADWVKLQAGQYHWYKFNYDDDDDWTQPVRIELYSRPDDLAVLTVRNGDQAELWRQDGEHAHFGCCVPEEITSTEENVDDIDEDRLAEETSRTAYALWSGDLGASGTYYIVVEHAQNSTEPTFYRFEMSGDGL